AAPDALREAVRRCLDSAGEPPAGAGAIIAPHAGYVYSGPVAASAYARLRGAGGRLQRAAVLGPAHFHRFEGLAVSAAEAFATPLGDVPLDRAGVEAVLALPRVQVLEAAFEEEHCIEVQLPFLQETLGDFSLVPLLVGEATPADAAAAIEALWDGRTLIVVSSDLSHHHPAGRAREIDGATARAIESNRPGEVGPGGACGHIAVRGLMEAAQRRGFKAQTVDLRHSGDTAGSHERVVGYGAFVFFDEEGKPA
ncbi:MAG: AmmeMemoRadiSam system protein B, partial [bacterium]